MSLKRERDDEDEDEVGREDGAPEVEEEEEGGKKKPRGPPWSKEEIAMLKKGMVVYGNKLWKDMAKHFPNRNATDLRLKYTEMGGAWGDPLRIFMHEHRFLKKQQAKDLNTKEWTVELTTEEKERLESGEEIQWVFEKQLSKRSHKDSDDEDDDDDSDDAAVLLLATSSLAVILLLLFFFSFSFLFLSRLPIQTLLLLRVRLATSKPSPCRTCWPSFPTTGRRPGDRAAPRRFWETTKR